MLAVRTKCDGRIKILEILHGAVNFRLADCLCAMYNLSMEIR